MATVRSWIWGLVGNIKRIHVKRHASKRNAKNDTQEPICSIKNRGKTIKGYRVVFEGPAIMTQNKPLGCGARVWIETRSRIVVDGMAID